jgi:aldehyde:ferredoxin oxidoreductase
MHWSVPAVGAWLKSVLIGHYRYYGVPNNWQLKKGKETYKACREKPGFTGWTPEGTAGITNWCNDVGALPTRNFKTSHCSYADNINGKAILKELKITDKGCFSCPIPCGKYGLAKTALGKAYVEGPEYETLSLLGSNCELSNIHDIAYTNYFCDELGLDTCSAGVVVGFALECYEKGYISRQEMGMDAVTGPIIFLAESPMKEGLF